VQTEVALLTDLSDRWDNDVKTDGRFALHQEQSMWQSTAWWPVWQSCKPVLSLCLFMFHRWSAVAGVIWSWMVCWWLGMFYGQV